MRLLKLFTSDQRGGATVEFGLVAPLLAGLVLLIAQGAILGFQFQDMRGAVHSGAQYIMGGGRDPVAVKTVSMSAWAKRPQGGDVAVALTCKCGTTPATCGVLCADKSQPNMFFTIRADADFNNPFYDHPVNVQQVVRVR